MPITPALSAGEQTNLSGPSVRRTYLAVVPETQVATARINAPSGLTFPLARLPVDTTSGGWLNTKGGHTVYIGTSAGASDVGVYLVRVAPSGTTALDIMEIGAADAGALAVQQQTKIADNHYVTIVQRYDIYSLLPRIIYTPPTSAEIFELYDQNAASYMQFPTPIVNVSVNNSRGGHFFTKVADGATVAITATATVAHWATSTSATYSWSYPGSFTGVSGGSTATLTATAPAGRHEIRCTVTPNLGLPIEIVRCVHVYDDTTTPAVQIGLPTLDTRDRTGRRVTLPLYDDTMADIPEGAMVALFDVCTWNGATVGTATTTFVGWFTRTRFTLERGGVRTAEPEIVGPAGILALLGNTSQEWASSGASVPLTWQQVRPQLCTLNFILWWLLAFRASNILKLFNYHPISMAPSSARNVKFEVAKGSLLSQLQGLARRYGEANFGCNSGGEFFFARHPNMIPYSSRASAVVTRDTLTSTKYAPEITFERRERPELRTVEGAAFWWDGLSTLPVAYRSVAPDKPGQGVGEEELTDLIVDGTTPQATLNTLTGLRYAWRNAAYAEITLRLPRNRDVYEPAEMSFVNVTIPAALHPLGVAWTFNGVPLAVSKRYLPGGATELEVTLEIETNGADGKTVPVPPPGQHANPDVPPIDTIIPDFDPDIDWGPEDDHNPDVEEEVSPVPGAPDQYGKAILATSDVHVARLVYPVAFADISPSTAVRALIGTAILLEQDAHDYKKVWLYGEGGLIYVQNWTATAVRWRTPVYSAVLAEGLDDLAPIDLKVANGSITAPELPMDVTFPGGPIPAGTQAGTFASGTGWTSEHIVISGANYEALFLRFAFQCPTRLGDPAIGVTVAGVNGSVNWQFYYKHTGTGVWTAGSSNGTSLVVGANTVTPNIGVSAYAYEWILVGRVNWGGGTPLFTYTLTDIDHTGDIDSSSCDVLDIAESLISDFRSLADKEGGYAWLSKRTVGGDPYVFFNRTLDNFGAVDHVQIARWNADMTYSIAACKHDYRRVFVSAGDPAESDAFVYESADGGGTFAATSRSLNARGGLLYWNWSTGTPNAANADPALLIVGIGLDGSDNYQVCLGVGGAPVTVATGAGKYPLSSRALWVEDRDQDNAYLVFQDSTLYKSTNASTSLTWSAVTSVPGSGTPRAACGYPSDPTFLYAAGLNALAYSKDSAATFTNIQSTYDTFADGAFGSGIGETIVTILPDLSVAYPIPVTGGA